MVNSTSSLRFASNKGTRAGMCGKLTAMNLIPYHHQSSTSSGSRLRISNFPESLCRQHGHCGSGKDAVLPAIQRTVRARSDAWHERGTTSSPEHVQEIPRRPRVEGRTALAPTPRHPRGKGLGEDRDPIALPRVSAIDGKWHFL